MTDLFIIILMIAVMLFAISSMMIAIQNRKHIYQLYEHIRDLHIDNTKLKSTLREYFLEEKKQIKNLKTDIQK